MTTREGAAAMGEGENAAFALGLDGALGRACRALDAAARGAGESQDELAARVDRCAHELEALIALVPENEASESDARRLRALRARVDGLGAAVGSLRERARRMHDMMAGMRRADLAVLAEVPGKDLPPRDRVFRDARANAPPRIAAAPVTHK